MATKAELTTGSASAATEHTEEPQLAELVTQETGSSKDGKVSVATLKDQSWMQEAVGPKAVVMAEEAARMCGDDAALRDVAALQTFTAAAAVDYSSPMATLTACHLVDPMCATPASLLGDATEHLYQLDHVYVTLPTKEASIKTKDNRLFARLDVWDSTKQRHGH